MRNLIFVFCLFLYGCGEPIDPRVGMDINNLTFKNTNLEPIQLATFKGRPSIINIWASWCLPCIKEMPSLMELQEQGNYQIILVNIDVQASQGIKILTKHGFKPKISLWDKQGKVMRNELSAMRLPQTFITDEHMVIQGVEMGDKEWVSSHMLKRIDNYLK